MKKALSMLILITLACAPASLLAGHQEQRVHVVRQEDMTLGNVVFRCACLAAGVVALNATIGFTGTSLVAGAGAVVCTIGATVNPPLIIPAIGLGATSVCTGVGAYFCGQFTSSCFSGAFNRNTVIVVTDQSAQEQ